MKECTLEDEKVCTILHKMMQLKVSPCRKRIAKENYTKMLALLELQKKPLSAN